jgi:hypothetical protein
VSSTATDRLPAAHARSILSCPASVELTVDGVAHPLEDDQRLGLQDNAGVPTLLCLPGGVLAEAAQASRSVLLTLRSGLRDGGDWDTLALAGSLRSTGHEACACCDDVRERVVVDVTFVLLTRTADGETTERCRVPLAEFRRGEHELNAGYLQRSAEHARLCHQEELRRAVAGRTNSRPAAIIGAQLAALTATGVRLEWVDAAGAHSASLDFPRTARTVEELGDLLRSELHPNIC